MRLHACKYEFTIVGSYKDVCQDFTKVSVSYAGYVLVRLLGFSLVNETV